MKYMKWVTIGAILMLIVGSILLGLSQVQAPNAADFNAPLDTFSAERAMEKVERIAQDPHPIMTDEHDKVRDYLIAELETLGLTPEVQWGMVNSKYYSSRGVVENIIARVPGADNSKAVMIAAHYDSVITSPGAADDASGIAAMLETVRAIRESGPLQNDLILLMTDGEEMGLLGAQEFIQEHPWAKEVGVVLNFEARGNQGPSFMFETSDGNGWLIKEFIDATPYPLANSLLSDAYKLLPNDTDFTVFRDGGMAGLNFAFGMGLDAYHTVLDTSENLDQGSLQHHGEYMLSLTRHLGNLNLIDIVEEDYIYFNAIRNWMVHYPQSWAIGLAIIGTFAYIITLWHGMRRNQLRVKGMIGGFLVSLLSIAVVGMIITLVWWGVQSVVSQEQYEHIVMDSSASLPYLIGLFLVMALIIYILNRWVLRRVQTFNLWAGILFLWVLFAITTSIFLPGGSYLFVWPLLCSIIGFNVSFYLDKGQWRWVATLFALPAFLLFAPICYILLMMLTLNAASVLFILITFAFTIIFPVLSSDRRVSNRAHVKKSYDYEKPSAGL
ncbi:MULTISPECIES: M20/M25/M40 family metallo-hydrolase [Paenibacillus]|uniref:Vacuolar membrane protease n=1 Tax=Paenibacillus pabuli TaxID=1472 RepID=A0A855YKV3_9BACL|nr:MULTISPECIES: M20/M25/M40 family metallo-hydrolase [Paenibacillus]PWW45504.1 peptidase M28-like protein [Paenibacillus pabuli]PXW11841.1 peptidase M28-like protein [Paenibacillus taichungensis]